MNVVRVYPGNFEYNTDGIERKYLTELESFIATTPTRSRIFSRKAVAFDLDETMGSFSDLYMLIWLKLPARNRTQPIFNKLLDLFPEFLRVDIMSIFEFLKDKIDKKECMPIYIYTNNQCEYPVWVEQIVEYIDYKLDASGEYSVFARPIFAYKIGRDRIEMNRTTHEKTYADFLKCSRVNHNTDVCFIDDQNHPKMKHPRVYFIHPPPYKHPLSAKDINDRFAKSDLYYQLLGKPRLFSLMPILSRPKSFPNTEWVKSEREITKQIMYHVREYFFMAFKRQYTRKKRTKLQSHFSRRRHTSSKVVLGHTLS